MKKPFPIIRLLAVCAIAAIAGACTAEIEVNTRRNLQEQLADADVTIVTIDGCQYLKPYHSTAGFMVHKGNCTNHVTK